MFNFCFGKFSGSSFIRPTPTTTTTKSPTKKDKVNKSTLFAAVGGAVLCSVVFIIVVCVCLHTKRCACPCGRRNTAQTVEPFENQQRTHRNVSRTNSVFTSHLNRSVGSLPSDEVISLRVLSPPPYISGPPPSIDSPTNSSSPPPPYSFNDPHPGAGRTDSLPGYPGEVGRYWCQQPIRLLCSNYFSVQSLMHILCQNYENLYYVIPLRNRSVLKTFFKYFCVLYNIFWLCIIM